MKLIFLSYWGINDPLTVSTIYPHLRILSEMDQVEGIDFCTIEREEDYHFPYALSELKKVEWTGFDSGHGIMDKLRDFYLIPKKLRKIIRENGIDALLCRGAPAGALGYLVWKKTKIPFYVESFEPHADYMLESGVWHRWDPRYLLEKYWEGKQNKYATALMPVANNFTEELKHKSIAPDRLHTMPCAVPVQEFGYNKEQRVIIRKKLGIPEGATTGIYVGKFGGLYYDTEAFHIFGQTLEFFPGFHLIICSPQPEESIREELGKMNFPQGRAHILFVPHDKIPGYLSAADFAYALYRPAPSKRFLSPIKVGEYWANGLPVLISEGIGDDSEIIAQEQAGAVLKKDFSDLEEAFHKVDEVIARDDHRQRIARLAGKHRSFDRTREVYAKLFEQ